MPRKPDPAKQKTRPDLSDQEWLVWLGLQPENRGIDIRALYRQMLDWCSRKGVTPTRRRLLRWLASDQEAMPMSAEPAMPEKPQPTAREWGKRWVEPLLGDTDS
ncbi:MAG: hypothetical protein R2682_15235 [Pyrinomonadaceae bacterium]